MLLYTPNKKKLMAWCSVDKCGNAERSNTLTLFFQNYTTTVLWIPYLNFFITNVLENCTLQTCVQKGYTLQNREMFYLKGSSRVDGQRVKVDARRSEAKRSGKLKNAKNIVLHCLCQLG